MADPAACSAAMPDYLAKLREQVGQEKALALRLKARGKVEWCVDLATRVLHGVSWLFLG